MSARGGFHPLVFLRLQSRGFGIGYHDRTKAAGATVAREPQTAPYGARFHAARDPEGFLWWVSNYAPVKAKQAGG